MKRSRIFWEQHVKSGILNMLGFIQEEAYYGYWDDLRFSASSINPPGAASDSDWDAINGGYLFAPGATEVLYVAVQLPHAWLEGSPIIPHVHWEKTTNATGNVLWRMRYEWSSHLVARTPLAIIEADTPVENIDTADTQMITSFGELDATDKEISSMLMIRLERVGGNGADTYGADARLLEFDIHYQTDSRGSKYQFKK